MTIRLLRSALLFGFALLRTASPVAAQQLNVTEHMLPNGMKVLLSEDHTVPSICLAIGYHVGSRNEHTGITGISHLFEHMMFNGSARFRPTVFDKVLESGGGYSNAFTANDITFYFEEFNTDILDTVLDMEADRVRALKLDTANVEQERGIVKEERRLRTDNDPQAKMIEDLYAEAFVEHPYHNPVVGWMADIDNITLGDCKEYFAIYYAPNNATMVVTGDFQSGAMLEKIEKSFGTIPAHEMPRSVCSGEPEQHGERRAELHKVAQLPSVAIGWKGAANSNPDFYALDILASVLSRGESSRLNDDLVYRKQMATEISASEDDYKDAGLFTIMAQAAPGHTTAELEEEVYRLIDSVKTFGISEQELQKAKNVVQADYVRRFKTNNGTATVLGYYDIVYGDYRKALKTVAMYDGVTAADVRRVAIDYLDASKRNVVTLVPESTSSTAEMPVH